MEQYKTVKISQESPDSGVFHLLLNRPSQLNTLTFDFFTEFPAALAALDQNPDTRVIILSASGNHFCAGIDLKTFTSPTSQSGSTTDLGRAGEKLCRDIKLLQDAVTAIERCRNPVIAAIHGGCIGGGVDIVTACDMRFCAKDAFFSVKEVDLGLTADLGTLQRLPRIVGHGVAMDLALTGRRVSGQEAKEICLVSRVFESKEDLDKGVSDVAETSCCIAAKSPLAVTGTKAVLLRSQDMSLDQGLDYVLLGTLRCLYPMILKRRFLPSFRKGSPSSPSFDVWLYGLHSITPFQQMEIDKLLINKDILG